MLMPKRVKHRKQHRGRMRGLATRGNTIQFGDFGIMAMECGWISSRQIEAARIAMTRSIKRGGQVWIRIFPDKPITKKPLEQRMGKGKAPVEGWVAVIKPGRVMFEMNGVPVEVAKEAMRLAIMKLPIRCKFVTKADFGLEAVLAGAGSGKSEKETVAWENPAKKQAAEPKSAPAEVKAAAEEPSEAIEAANDQPADEETN